jgi:hypothetical protein
MSLAANCSLAWLSYLSIRFFPSCHRLNRPLQICALTPIACERILKVRTFMGDQWAAASPTGVSRIVFSDADIAGRNYVMRRMREFDLEPRVDSGGKYFLERELDYCRT